MAVERVKKRRETHPLGRLKLYRDDMEAIARVLAEFGTLSFLVNEEVSGNEPEDFAKIRDELPERLDLVQMAATREGLHVVVEIGPGAKVGLVEPDIAAYGALTRVQQICAPCRMGRSWWLLLVLAAVCFVSVAGGIVALTLNERMFQETGLVSGVIALIFGGLGLGISGAAVRASSEKGGSEVKDIILNVPRAERPTFGQRLVADGGVSFFWAAVGLIGGGLIGYLVNQLPGL
ncbi:MULTISPECIES: hypothetical protein [Nocardiopsis]|uniref:Uncharacterized protein n=1 Tax=Nocardiopsis sinuspersici TaxID=501010 RepID=A0A1V3BVD8_9ACTN|nr:MULTISPECIES: hypothetical protein [Nocardiopsis]OOC52614.1 hypothetical protein NOSIN_01200 [Nocardiopsis sinuspersici]